MPRFVILRHELPADSPRPTHFDLMFEEGSVLRTWACEQLPSADSPVIAEQLADHRLAYLNYEGPVSGNRGTVTQIDAAGYEVLLDSPTEFRVRISGQQLRGMLSLCRETAAAQRWVGTFVSE